MLIVIILSKEKKVTLRFLKQIKRNRLMMSSDVYMRTLFTRIICLSRGFCLKNQAVPTCLTSDAYNYLIE